MVISGSSGVVWPAGRASCLQRGRSGQARSGQGISTVSHAVGAGNATQEPRGLGSASRPAGRPEALGRAGLPWFRSCPSRRLRQTWFTTWVHLLAVTLTHLGLPRTAWAGEPSAWCPVRSRCSLNGGAAPGFGDQHRLVAACPLVVSLHRFIRADFRSPAWPSHRPPRVHLTASMYCSPPSPPSFLSAVNPRAAARAEFDVGPAEAGAPRGASPHVGATDQSLLCSARPPDVRGQDPLESTHVSKTPAPPRCTAACPGPVWGLSPPQGSCGWAGRAGAPDCRTGAGLGRSGPSLRCDFLGWAWEGRHHVRVGSERRDSRHSPRFPRARFAFCPPGAPSSGDAQASPDVPGGAQ